MRAFMDCLPCSLISKVNRRRQSWKRVCSLIELMLYVLDKQTINHVGMCYWVLASTEQSCADPLSLLRGGPTLITFFFVFVFFFC